MNIRQSLVGMSLCFMAATSYVSAQQNSYHPEKKAPLEFHESQYSSGSTVTISEVSKSPLGVSVKFKLLPFSNIYVKKRVNGGDWENFSFDTKKYQVNSEWWGQIDDPIATQQNNVQYKVKMCESWNCASKSWSAPSSSINFAYYERDTNDDNGNGVRNDVESTISFLAARDSFEYDILNGYAYWLSRLLNNDPKPSALNAIFFGNMTGAINCIADKSKLIDIKSMLLDTDAAFDKYMDASNQIANSSYGNYQYEAACRASPSANSGLPNDPPMSMIDEAKLRSWLKNVEEKEQNPQSTKVLEASETLINGLHNTLNAASGNGLKANLIYVNGMLTTKEDADANRGYIEKLFDEYWGKRHVHVSLAYNQRNSIMEDLLQALRQYISAPNAAQEKFEILREINRFASGIPTLNLPANKIVEHLVSNQHFDTIEAQDRQNLVTKLSEGLADGKVVLLSHSQGNFYANDVWSEVNSSLGGRGNDFVRVYGLGTPASHVAGDGYYYTNRGDVVIAGIRIFGPIDPKPYNISINSNDISGHGLVATYLKEGASHTDLIVQRVSQHFSDMGVSPNDEPGVCVPYSALGSTTSYERHTYNHTPFTNDSFKGRLRLNTTPGLGQHKFHFIDQRGHTLWETSFSVYGQQRTINYDSAINGRIRIDVYGAASVSNSYSFTINCEGSNIM